MNEDAIKDAYDLFVNTGYNKSYDNFKKLIQSNPNARKDAYDLFVGTGYNKTQKDFDELMGIGAPASVKKKESVSPSQQSQQPTLSATGEMGPDGAPVPSVRKRYDVKGKPAQPIITAAPAAQLTAKDLDMMMPFMGAVQETTVVDQQPTMQEKLQSEVNLAAGALTAASKPGFKPVTQEEADKALFGKAKVQAGTLRGVPGERAITVKNLNDKYKSLGVQFEEAPSKIQKAVGLGDIVVTSDDGSTHIVQSTGSDEKLREEEAKLQSFLMGKSAGVEKKPITPIEFLMMSRDGISPQEEGKFKRVYSQEMVDNSIKFANDELNNTKAAVDGINKEISELNDEAKKISEIVAVSGVTSEIEDTYNSITQRYESLKLKADERINYAKSIGALADEGLKKAVGENTRLLSYNGNIPAVLYNSLLKGVKDIVGGAMATMPEISDILTMGASEKFYGDKAKAKENSAKMLNEVYDNLKAEGVSKEYTSESNMVLKALFSVPEFIPTLLIPGGAAARISAMTTQGIGRRYEEMNSNPETKNLSEEEKFFMAAGPAFVEAKLENFGITQWLGSNKGLASSVFISALSKVAPQAGMRGLNKIINAEISNLALRGAANTAGAMITEFETGALQNISETAFKDAYEIAKGKNLFKQPGFGEKDFAKTLLEDAVMEGLGGMWMSGAVNVAQQTSEYITGKSNTNETFKLVKQILTDGNTAKSLLATLKTQMMNGNISKDQAMNVISNFKEARAIAMELPQDLSEDNQRKAFDLLAEKRKLTKQIEGKDPSLVDKQKTRITAIDQELKNISNAVQEQATSEVPVQPGAAVGGEVAQGEPEAEPQVVTEEGVQEEVIPGSKAVISGVDITYPTQEQRAERETVRNSQEYVNARSIELPVTDTEILAEDLNGEFAMVTGENPKGEPLTEEENQALNQKAQEWLTSRGYDPKPIVGKFNQAENSFFVKGMTEADAIEFAQEFDQKSVAHSGGMLYQDGSRNPRTAGDDFTFGKFEPGMDMVSIVNTTDGPRQFSVAYDFKTTIESDTVSDFDQAAINSAQSLKVVAPDLKIIVAENTEDAQLQIAEALSAVAPTQAATVAEGFTTETRGQTVFVNGKPFAIVLDRSQADTVTIGHEIWETLLNDAFGNDQAKFKEFRDEIDRQLRLNGLEGVADALTAFSNQRGYEDVRYSEYMAELGGMLVANGFKKGSLDAKQKSLLQKIGDVINKFAQLFTGKKQFLDEATPDDILGFMITISNKVAKGEDVSSFFREKNTQEIKDTKKVFSNRSQKIGDFDIQYFEDDAEFKDLVDRGLVVQNASIDEAGGQPVAIHQPDNLLVGNINYKGKKIMEGNGGIYYVLKFGNVWASGKQTSAKTLSGYINKSRKESTDGIGRMVLVRGSQDKMISSVQGVKAAMRILEELVFDNLISTSDFRKSLNAAGKSYNIDFSGSNSAKQIQKDIEDKFMNVSDSTFSDRGGFFSKLIDEIGKLESANKNIKEIRKALGTTKNIQFSREGIRKQIGTVLTERLLIGLDNSHAYAIVEVEEDVVVKKDDQHPSYPFSIVTKSGKPPVLKVFNYRPKAVEAITTMSGEKASNAQLGLAQMGMGMGRVASDKEIVVKSRSQKSVPAVVDEVLTDDGKGNYVFVHYSEERRDTIKPMSGSNKNFTSREEVAAISSVGGVSMYYTKQGQKEQGVGNVAHTVLIPKDKVYFYGTTEKGKVSNDPENFEPEARRRFQEYKNRNNPTRPTTYAFDSNNSAAWVGKVASENGYDMLVTNWGGPKSYRAQSVKEMTPETDYTGFKEIPESNYEVGDEIFVYGSYGEVTGKDGDVITYQTENSSGKFDTKGRDRDRLMLIQKAKPVITVRAQKKDTYTNQQYGDMYKNGVVFHGGTNSIDKLDPSKVKGGFRAIYGWGVYFAGTIYKAADYGDMITFLNSKALKFIKVNNEVTSGLISELGKIKDKNIYYDLFVDKLKNMVGTEINEARLRMGDFIRWDYDELWSQMFMDAGYDGFNQNDNEYVVFNIDKANQEILEDPLNVTTKSQKVIVDTIPGYDRMMGEVEGILDKTMNRTGSYNQASANAIGYIQKSAVYERADDSQREQIIRDFVKIRGEKIKVAPSVGKILGQIKDTKKVTVNERTALKDQIKLEAKAAKDAVAFVKQLRVQMSSALRGMAGRGVISAKQAASILSRYDKMNILNPDMRDRFVDYMSNVFQSAEYADKVKQASKLRSTIKKAAKSPDNQAENSKQAKVFAEIDPSRVADIDEYINNAEQVLSTVSRKTGTVKMRNIVNMPDTIAYIDGEIQAQREQIKNEILSKYQDLVDAGVLDSKMTINEIKKVVAAIEENEDESTAKAKEAKNAVKQMMDELSPILLQIARTGEDPFTGDPIDLTPDERAAIVKLAKMDIDSLSLAEAIKVIEYANNFIANGVTSGIVGMVDLYQGSLNAEELVKKGFKSIPFKKYFSKGAGRVWAEQIASLPMLAKLMWGSTSRALTVSVASGVTGVSNGKAKAIKIVEKAVKEYVSTFSKTKDFLSSENVIERGMLAFVSRSVVGDEFQVQDEFNRRKSLVEETIQALKDPDNSTEAEIKKGEVVEKVYNKILKDAKNAKEVRANVSEINKKAVDWWVNEWSKHYDRMDEVSRNVYNTLLSRDSNFTPDRFQLKEVSPAAEGDFDSGFFGNFENVSTEKSGSLKENKRIKNLPQNKNGVKTRIVNLDFDINNVNALTNAIVDVETAGSVMQMKGFVTSKDFSKLFSSKEDRNLYKKRLVSYVNRAKGQGYIDTSELKSLNRLANAIASFGTAKALFSLSQPFKQSIPPLLNTLVQTGRIDVATLFKGGFSFIDRTGYPIANRGISSQGELKSINRQLVEADKNLLLRGLDGVAQYSNLMLEITLKYPDIATARASWLSFYKKGLKKEGIKTSDINWITHEVNSKAADYAQMMIDSQQNISDSDMQGEFLASKDPAKAFLRRAIFPLMTFVLNQKTRIWADIRTISNKDVTTVEDRQEALLSLSGALVELGVFSAISLGASTILYNIATSIFGDDEEDKEEDKKKMIMRRSAYTAQNFMKDFFLPPIPGMDLIASKGMNYILDETGLSDEIPANWFGIEDDSVKFRLYDKANQGYLDMLGTQGIAIEKALELTEYYNMAITGQFTEDSYGTQRTKAILEEDADMARINAAIMTGYYGGLLPTDVAYIVGQINKKIKKRSEVVEEED